MSAADPSNAHVAPASWAAAAALPGRVVARSRDVGWRTSLLVQLAEWSGPAEVAFETLPTPDQWIALSTRGQHDVECCSGGRWRRAFKPAGSGGLTPGGVTDRLRMRPHGADPVGLAHLYLPPAYLVEAVEAFHRTGAPHRSEPLNALAFTDRVVTHAVRSLVDAMRAGAPDLYAQTVAQYLATHLLSRHSRWSDRTGDARAPEPLSDRRLARVLDYMRVHYREALTLERLAAEAGISKFHFARLFRAATGAPPHRFLVRLRMDAARQMLRDTEMTTADVASASGYASAAQFATAFARHVGCAPGTFRTSLRGPRRHTSGVARPAPAPSPARSPAARTARPRGGTPG